MPDPHPPTVSTTGAIVSGFKTDTLGSDAVEIDCTSAHEVIIYATQSFYVATAASSGAAATALSADATRAILPAGVFTFGVRHLENLGLNIYVKAVSTAGTVSQFKGAV